MRFTPSAARLGTLLVGLLGIGILWTLDSCTSNPSSPPPAPAAGSVASAATVPSTKPAKPKRKPESTQPTTEELNELHAFLTTQPSSFPGNGLAQHDFLYCGEWDTRKPVQTIFLVRGGKVVWTYSIPTNDRHHVLSEFDDIHYLSNGNVVYACKTGWGEVTTDTPAKQVFFYECPAGFECHSAQPIGLDKVLFMQNGNPPQLMLMNITTGKIEMTHALDAKFPTKSHAQFRHVRMTAAGTYLVAHLDLGKVVEYDPNQNWKPIWSCDAKSVWAAVRLKNGNTLLSGNQGAWVREVDPSGKVVWEVDKDDIPGIPLHSVQEADRLDNGDTVICNWTAGVKRYMWPGIVQIVEVNPAKQVVWAFRSWTDPDLGPASCIQLLDEPGKEEVPGDHGR
jgi:hypothetical protein